MKKLNNKSISVPFKYKSTINGISTYYWIEIIDFPKFIINNDSIQIDLLVRNGEREYGLTYMVKIQKDKSYDLRKIYNVIDLIRDKNSICG